MINYSNENYLMDDANSPELDKKLIGRITEDFIKVCDHLKEASYQIRKREFSEFPIFVASDTHSPIGTVLYKNTEFDSRYTYNASFVEEFVQRELIATESLDLFKENYKNADEFCCLFVMEGNFAGFVFIPFPND